MLTPYEKSPLWNSAYMEHVLRDTLRRGFRVPQGELAANLPRLYLLSVKVNLLELAKSGATSALGAAIVALPTLNPDDLAGLAHILVRGNSSAISNHPENDQGKHFYKAARAVIEALFQREASTELAKLAFCSWRSFEESPLSNRCLDAAVDLKQLDSLYDLAHYNSDKPKFHECAAHLILKLAKAGHQDAFFITGEFFRDGYGLKKDIAEAKKWFRKAAVIGSVQASTDLGVVPDAFRELAKLEQNQELKSFYEHQASVAEKAKNDLFAILPKDVLAELIAGGESDQVEFKSMANKGLDGVLQEVAAFLNLDGGQLFIGIENTTPHAAVNLEMSYKEVGVSNSDQFQRHLLEKFYSSLDENFYHSDIKIEFPTYMNQKICHIKIRRGERPVHLKQNGKKCFYVRIGNSKRELLPGKVQQYCKQRWPEE